MRRGRRQTHEERALPLRLLASPRRGVEVLDPAQKSPDPCDGAIRYFGIDNFFGVRAS